jgi:hypothetical protein
VRVNLSGKSQIESMTFFNFTPSPNQAPSIGAVWLFMVCILRYAFTNLPDSKKVVIVKQPGKMTS